MHFPPLPSPFLPTSSFIDIFPARHFFMFYAFCTRICNEHWNSSTLASKCELTTDPSLGESERERDRERGGWRRAAEKCQLRVQSFQVKCRAKMYKGYKRYKRVQQWYKQAFSSSSWYPLVFRSVPHSMTFRTVACILDPNNAPICGPLRAYTSEKAEEEEGEEKVQSA